MNSQSACACPQGPAINPTTVQQAHNTQLSDTAVVKQLLKKVPTAVDLLNMEEDSMAFCANAGLAHPIKPAQLVPRRTQVAPAVHAHDGGYVRRRNGRALHARAHAGMGPSCYSPNGTCARRSMRTISMAAACSSLSVTRHGEVYIRSAPAWQALRTTLRTDRALPLPLARTPTIARNNGASM